MRIAKKYGAMAILLPLSDKGLPENLDEKKEIIRRLLEIADEEGLSRDSLIIDGLVATVGANRMAALETLDTIATICGLSNISFGLPERINVNTAFLTMAIANGLTMAICNPGQAMLVNASLAADLLLAKEDSDNIYVENVVALSQTEQTAAKNVAGVSEEGVSVTPLEERRKSFTCSPSSSLEIAFEIAGWLINSISAALLIFPVLATV